MNSAWYGLAMVAIFIVVYWLITNDSLPDGKTKGLFAMKLPGRAGVIRRSRKRPKFSPKDVR